MITRLHAFVSLLVLGTAAVAAAAPRSPESPMTVFVTVAAGSPAGADVQYDAATLDELIGSAEDVKKAVVGAGIRGRRKHLVLVDSAAEAQLVVEVQARRSKYGFGVFGRNYFVLFGIKRGGQLSTGLVERSVEAHGKGSWKVAGAVVADIVDRFAEDQAATLTKTASVTR